MPGVVLGGVLDSAANIDPTWVENPITKRLGRSLKRPVTVINDADAAGTAEMRFGVGAGKPGVVVLLAASSGLASKFAVFIDGKLVPNTQYGQMEIRGRPAEQRCRIRRPDQAPTCGWESMDAGPRRALDPHRRADLA